MSLRSAFCRIRRSGGRRERRFGPRTSGRGVMSIEQRSRERRKRIVVHRAEDYEDAERWDLEFWQAMTPQERLSALVAIRRDVEKVRAARRRPDRC